MSHRIRPFEDWFFHFSYASWFSSFAWICGVPPGFSFALFLFALSVSASVLLVRRSKASLHPLQALSPSKTQTSLQRLHLPVLDQAAVELPAHQAVDRGAAEPSASVPVVREALLPEPPQPEAVSIPEAGGRRSVGFGGAASESMGGAPDGSIQQNPTPSSSGTGADSSHHRMMQAFSQRDGSSARSLVAALPHQGEFLSTSLLAQKQRASGAKSSTSHKKDGGKGGALRDRSLVVPKHLRGSKRPSILKSAGEQTGYPLDRLLKQQSWAVGAQQPSHQLSNERLPALEPKNSEQPSGLAEDMALFWAEQRQERERALEEQKRALAEQRRALAEQRRSLVEQRQEYERFWAEQRQERERFLEEQRQARAQTDRMRAETDRIMIENQMLMMHGMIFQPQNAHPAGLGLPAPISFISPPSPTVLDEPLSDRDSYSASPSSLSVASLCSSFSTLSGGVSTEASGPIQETTFDAQAYSDAENDGLRSPRRPV